MKLSESLGVTKAVPIGESYEIGVLEAGDVAKTLASSFLKHGHDVMLGTSDSAKLAEWKAQNLQGEAGSFEQAAAFGDLVVLAVKGSSGVLTAKPMKRLR